MWKIVLVSYCLFIYGANGDEDFFDGFSEQQQPPVVTVAEDKITQKVYAIIDHFKKDDPVGIPSLEIPDPISIPDVQQNINVGKLFMTKVNAYGVSQFRIQNVTVEVDRKMEANCGLLFETLILKGNYSLSSFLARSQGPFVIIISNVVVTANASLIINRDGKIRTNEIEADITLAKMNVSFSNLGLLASFFQSFANSAGNVLFDNVKPYILKDAKEKIRTEFDKNIDEYLGEFGLIPNSISPVDYVIAELRKKVRESYDPFEVSPYENGGIIGIKTYDTILHGVSSFYRVGDLILQMMNNNLIINLEVGTQEIRGKTSWEMSLAKGMITRRGNVQFSVQYIKVFVSLRQPMNLKKQLIINDLQINLGNIQIMSSGLGTLDYIIELFVNVLPNLLRYQIVDAIEKPIVNKIQSIVNRIDIEDLVKELLRQYRNNETLSIDFRHFEL